MRIYMFTSENEASILITSNKTMYTFQHNVLLVIAGDPTESHDMSVEKAWRLNDMKQRLNAYKLLEVPAVVYPKVSGGKTGGVWTPGWC